MTDLQLIKLSVKQLQVKRECLQKDIGSLLGYTSESAFSQVLNGHVDLPADLLGRMAELDDDIKNFINANKATREHPITESAFILREPERKGVNYSKKKTLEEKKEEYFELTVKAQRLLLEIISEESKNKS